jgi:hypothetical protein
MVRRTGRSRPRGRRCRSRGRAPRRDTVGRIRPALPGNPPCSRVRPWRVAPSARTRPTGYGLTPPEIPPPLRGVRDDTGTRPTPPARACCGSAAWGVPRPPCPGARRCGP